MAIVVLDPRPVSNRGAVRLGWPSSVRAPDTENPKGLSSSFCNLSPRNRPQQHTVCTLYQPMQRVAQARTHAQVAHTRHARMHAGAGRTPPRARTRHAGTVGARNEPETRAFIPSTQGCRSDSEARPAHQRGTQSLLAMRCCGRPSQLLIAWTARMQRPSR